MTERDLNRGWRVWRFDQMAEYVRDSVDNPNEAGVERYVGLEHLDSDSLKIRRWGSPSDVEATKLVFRKGDIIFGRRRAYQRKLAVADFDGICSAHAMVLRARPEVALPDFLPFFMQSDLFMSRALEISVGSLSPTINWNTLAVQAFALPPLEEQERLLAVFQAGLELVDAWHHTLRAARNGLAAAREHAFQDGYPSIALGEVLRDIEAGRSVSGTNMAPLYGEYAVLKVSAVGDDGFRPQEVKTLVSQHEFMPKYSVRAGDLILTRANTPDLVGMSCLVDADHPTLMLCDKTLRLVPKTGFAAELLFEALWTTSVRQQLKAVATGTGAAMKNISQDKIRKIKVHLPLDSAEQSKLLGHLRFLRVGVKNVQRRADQASELYRHVVAETLWASAGR